MHVEGNTGSVVAVAARCLFAVLVCLGGSTGRAQPIEMIPAAAPLGARVVVAGSGIEHSTSLTFAGPEGSRIAAPVVNRGQSFLETTVPAHAVSGVVRVSTAIGEREGPFTVAASAPYVTVSTVAANTGAQMPFHNPEGIAFDSRSGTLYVADTKHHQIKVVDPEGRISVLAGSGVPGLLDGAGGNAQFKEPKGLALDPTANALYVADSANHAIRRVTFTGVVTTIAGGDAPGDRDGAGAVAQFKQPSAIALGANGALYIADTMNHKVRRVDSNGTVSTVAGTGRDGYTDGNASEARFASPEGIIVSASGVVYVADTGNHRLRAIEGEMVSTVAGSGEAGFVDGPPFVARFHSPRGLAMDEAGNLIVADRGNDLVRGIAAGTFVVRTIAGQVPANNRKERIDGPVLDARFSSPRAVVSADAIYVADTDNDALRRISLELTLADIFPRRGPVAGGTELRLFGTGFAASGTSVTIGDNAIAPVTFVSSTELIVTTPPHPSGSVDIVIRADGSTVTLSGAYTFVAPPSILSVTPAKAASAGGDRVTILGSNFIAGATEFLFAGAAATDASVADATIAQATTPAGAHGPADVIARTPGGEATLTSGFRFFAPPTVFGFTPGSGSAGTVVVIDGDRFDGDASGNVVRFGAESAVITSATPTSITALVPPNAVTAPITVSTVGGTGMSGTNFVVPILTSIAITPASSEVAPGATLQLHATGTYSDGQTTDLTATALWATTSASTATVNATGLVAALAAGEATIRAQREGITGFAQVTVKSANAPPADPATFAPANDPTVPTRFSDSFRFLYSGPTAIQHDVVPGAVEEKRMVVLRGRVVDASGVPVPSARVSIHSDPQLGWTLSRADGMFDIVANGGGYVTVVIEKEGSITVHRRAAAGWHDYVALDDAVLIPYDTHATVLDLPNLTSIAIARGSQVTDASGYRQATLLFAPGTKATMRHSDGTEAILSTITVRATEQTVGERGAMPASLPPESAYTYCVELSVDEAVAAGANSVLFSKPVALYLENFMNFPVGFEVPVGFYDRDKGEWIASDNGRVLKVMSIIGGIAAVDSDGDGGADNAMGISEDELRAVAALYVPGQTIWRVRVSHFTPCDANAGVSPPFGAIEPDGPEPESITVLLDDPACQNGSIIECENLTLGESIPVAGTPFTLEYRSRRTAGFRAARKARIVASGATVPAPLQSINLFIQVAGRSWDIDLPPAPNQTYTFEWDGLDVMGRPVYGPVEARLLVGYVYAGVLGNSAPIARSFGMPTKGSIFIGARAVVTWFQPEQRFELRAFAPSPGIAEGWTLSGVDTIAEGRLYEGNGRESLLNPTPAVFQYVKAPFYSPAPDGSVNWSEYGSIWRYADGETTFVAGGGTYPAPPTDGGSATGVYLNAGPIRFDAAGNPIFYDGPTQAIFRLRSGTLQRIAEIPLSQRPRSMVVTASGAIYYAGDDGGLYRLDGGGNEYRVYPGYEPYAFSTLWLGSDDSIYASIYIGGGDSGIYKIRLDGSAPEKLPNLPGCVAGVNVAANGDLYYTRDSLESGCGFVKPGLFVLDANGDTREIKPLVPLVHPGAITLLADGRVLYDEMDSRSVCGGLRTCTRQLGGTFGEDLFSNEIVDPDTGTIRRFSAIGKHVQTRNAAGDVLRTMQYDADGRLASIHDGDGRETRIERDASGVAAAIVAPGGLRTELTVENDRLREITAPGGLQHSFAYSPNGLLTQYRNPRRFATTYSYDESGRLEVATDAKGGSKSLAHERVERTDKVSVTTAGAQRTQYEITRIDATTRSRTLTNLANLTTSSEESAATKAITRPDGTRIDVTYRADPRPGATDSIPTSLTIKTPAGLTSRAAFGRSVTLDPNNALRTLTDTFVVNNRTVTSTFTASTRTVRTTTPAGRVFERTYDARGRLLSLRDPAYAAMSFTYDAAGRMEGMTQGARQYAFGWSSEDRLTSVTDALNRTAEITYDDAGRPTTLSLPGNRVITMTHDANGNLLSLSPPGRSAHLFTYDSVDLPATMVPPGLDGPASAASFSFDTDRRLRSISEGGRNITIDYDSNGRASTISDLVNQLTFGYDSAGRLASIANATGSSLTYAWDGFLELGVTWSGTITGSLAWTYDNELRVTSESVNGSAIPFGYDPDSLLLSAGPVTLTRSAASGQVTQVATGTATEQYSYNEFGETSNATAKYAGAPLLSFLYTRDSAGRITSITASGDTTGYEYDAAGRLSRVTRGGANIAEYDYDANGNRLAHRWIGGSAAATYDEQDRLLTYGDATYTYTPDGMLQSRTLAGATTTYDYDVFGNLRTVALPGGSTINCVIDGENRRVGKKVNGTLTQGFLYSGPLQIVAELDGSNAVVTRFIYGSRANVPDAMIRNGVTYRIFSDHLGSPRLIVNATTGAVAQELRYDEFGNVLFDTNPGFQPFGFAGGVYDRDTRLVRFGARDYDPHVGRWTGKDPILFQSTTNVYEYAFNDPLNFFDPEGLDGKAAAAWARKQVGSDEYGTLDPHPESRGRFTTPLGGRGFKAFKCNAFVWDVLTAGGDPAGRMPGGRIPSAGEWADPFARIPGYYVVPPGSKLKEGDVVAFSGHMGLYVPLPSGAPGTISAAAGPGGDVVHNDWGFRKGQSPIIRRCGCDGAP